MEDDIAEAEEEADLAEGEHIFHNSSNNNNNNLFDTPMKVTTATASSSNPFDQILAQSAQAAQSLTLLNLSPERPSAATTSNPPATSSAPSISSFPPIIASGPRTPSPVSLIAAQARLKKNPYAPAVPSPLSRILRMADSPLERSTSPDSGDDANKWNLANVIEEEDESGPMDGISATTRPTSLAEELGLGPNDDSPTLVPTKTRVQRTPSPAKRYTAREKGKGRTANGLPPGPSVASGAGAGGGGGVFKTREKENAVPAGRKISVGHRVVGGRGAPIVPNLMRRAAPSKLGSSTGGPPKSIRDEVKARNLVAQGIARRAPIIPNPK